MLEGDFAVCMETLQRASDSVEDIRGLLDSANNICAKYLRSIDDNVHKNYKYSFLNKH